jgi:hypothetical protein
VVAGAARESIGAYWPIKAEFDTAGAVPLGEADGERRIDCR